MPTLLPSFSEAAYSTLAPRWLKDTNTEHEVSRLTRRTDDLARTAADIRELTRQQLRSQLEASRHLIAAQAAVHTGNFEIQGLLSRVGEELVAVRSAVERFHTEAAQQLSQIDQHLIQGFNLIVERLDELAKREQQQSDLLVRIVDLLSSPYEVRTIELRKKADILFDTTLRLNNENRDDNFQTALELYEDIVKERAGKTDYWVWFQIGWIHWQVTGNLASAERAFNNSQRLSDGREDERVFRAKCLRHLARVRFQLGDPNAALVTIDRAIKLDAPPSAHHDAAVYASASGNRELTIQHLRIAIQGDVTLFSRALADSELGYPWLQSWLLEQEGLSKDRARTEVFRASAMVERLSPLAQHFADNSFSSYQTDLRRITEQAANQTSASYATWREIERECKKLTSSLIDYSEALVKKLRTALEAECSSFATRLGRAPEVTRTERERAERLHSSTVADIRSKTKVTLKPPEAININWLVRGDGNHPWLRLLTWPFLFFLFLWVTSKIKGEMPNVWATLGAAAVVCAFVIGALDALTKWIYGVTQYFPEKNARDAQSEKLLSEEERRHRVLLLAQEAQGKAEADELKMKIDNLRVDIARSSEWLRTLSEMNSGNHDAELGPAPDRRR